MYWITQQNFVGPKYNKRFEKSNTSLTFKNTKNSIQLFQMREDSVLQGLYGTEKKRNTKNKTIQDLPIRSIVSIIGISSSQIFQYSIILSTKYFMNKVKWMELHGIYEMVLFVVKSLFIKVSLNNTVDIPPFFIIQMGKSGSNLKIINYSFLKLGLFCWWYFLFLYLWMCRLCIFYIEQYKTRIKLI